MALSSQMTARGGGASSSAGRRRSRPKRVIAFVAIALLAWAGWSIFFSGSPQQPAGEQVATVPGDPQPDATATAGVDEDESRGGFDSVAAGLAGERGNDSADGSTSRSTPPEAFSPPPPPDRTTPATDDVASLADDPSSNDADDGDDGESAASSEPDDESASEDADEPSAVALADAERSGSGDGAGSGEPSDAEARRLMEQGQQLYEEGDLVDARAVLNTALTSGGLNEDDARDVRDLMTQINETLVFSPRVDPDDPYVDRYQVQSGDSLGRIAPRYNVPWQLIARINGITDPGRIRVGQDLKVIKGPFHVVVHKRAYRLDLFVGDMYVRSYPVGLGEHDMTPTGEFIVRRNSKLTNPEWTNPRTGERYLPDDPENPLGGYWIGIRGTTEETERYTGYGIHGTIEPDTIGTDASMGCVRLLPEDVGEIYRMLTEEQSRVLVIN